MIHCYQFYASPVISKPRYFELFFHFPWFFEIAGFNCIIRTYKFVPAFSQKMKISLCVTIQDSIKHFRHLRNFDIEHPFKSIASLQHTRILEWTRTYNQFKIEYDWKLKIQQGSTVNERVTRMKKRKWKTENNSFNFSKVITKPSTVNHLRMNI